ncbi:MAG: electron transfer flavoprotein subunit alpha/FixB family protein [Thermoplasmata archaeon]
MRVLVHSEKEDVALELVSKAGQLWSNGFVGVLPLHDVRERASRYFGFGADVVYAVSPLPPSASQCAHMLHQIMDREGFDLVLVGSTRPGKEVSSRLAQRIGCACITDAIDLRVEDEQVLADRYALAGNTIATELVVSDRGVISVLPHSFQKVESPREGRVVDFTTDLGEERAKVVERMEKVSEDVMIENADIIVGVGKGFAKKEDLEVAFELARALGGEVGCTRPLAVDYGWLSENRGIGLSSTKVSPKLYIAIGISGQIQHTVGVMRSKTIMAINRNSEAPIFEVSDYGIVGDLYKVVPHLTESVRRLMSGG